VAVIAHDRANNCVLQSGSPAVLAAGDVLGLAENLQFTEAALAHPVVAEQAKHVTVGLQTR
jgi:hypothetical protein